MAASFGFAQILSLSLRLVAAHDPQDDPGDHEGEQEEYDVEDNGRDLHGELIRSYWFIDLTEKPEELFFQPCQNKTHLTKRLIIQNRPYL